MFKIINNKRGRFISLSKEKYLIMKRKK